MPVVAVCLAERGNAVNVGHPRTRGAGGTAEADGDAGRHARQVRDKRGAWLRTYKYHRVNWLSGQVWEWQEKRKTFSDFSLRSSPLVFFFTSLLS